MQQEQKPLYIVFAGIAGAGKSTLCASGLWAQSKELLELPRVSSEDLLAQTGGNPVNSQDQFFAGKEAIRLCDEYFERGVSFCQETTLCETASLQRIKQAAQAGYSVQMFYVGVDSVRIVIDRIALLPSSAARDITAATIRKQYQESIDNLIEAFQYCDSLVLMDNSRSLSMVASLTHQDSFVATELHGPRWPERILEELR